MTRAALFALLLASPALAQDLTPLDIAALPGPLVERIGTAAVECNGLDNGNLTVAASALTRPDLDRDGTPDWILDEAGFACTSSTSFFCGSGGCNNTVVIGEAATDVFAKKLEVFEGEYFTALIAWVHGNACGGGNATPCALAMVWDGSTWRTVQDTK